MSSKEEEINDVSDSDRKTFNDMFMVFDYNGDGSVEASDVKQVQCFFVFGVTRATIFTLREKTKQINRHSKQHLDEIYLMTKSKK